MAITNMLCRYGIRAFDTSAYYGPSELVLGAALKTLAPEFPRESYQLVRSMSKTVASLLIVRNGQLTKCGRYGGTKEDFDYSPQTIRDSVKRSLARLNTTYLDVVYLHDIEFVCESVQARPSGDPSVALLPNQADKYGLASGQEAKI